MYLVYRTRTIAFLLFISVVVLLMGGVVAVPLSAIWEAGTALLFFIFVARFARSCPPQVLRPLLAVEVRSLDQGPRCRQLLGRVGVYSSMKRYEAALLSLWRSRLHPLHRLTAPLLCRDQLLNYLIATRIVLVAWYFICLPAADNIHRGTL